MSEDLQEAYRPPGSSLTVDEAPDPSIDRAFSDGMATLSIPLAVALSLTALPGMLLATLYEPAPLETPWAFLIANLLFAVLLTPLGYCVALAAAAHREHHEMAGVGTLLAEGVRAWPRVLVSLVVPYVVTLLGFIFFLIPGLYLVVRFAFVPVVAFEGGRESALYRDESAALMRGRFWRVTFLMLIFLIPPVLVNVSVGWLGLVVPALASPWVTLPVGLATSVYSGLMVAALRAYRKNLMDVGAFSR